VRDLVNLFLLLTGVDLLDWFSKQLNSDIMVAPNGIVLPSAPPLKEAQVQQQFEPQCVPKQPPITATASPNHSSTTDSCCVQLQLAQQQLKQAKAAEVDDVDVQNLVKRDDHMRRTCASSRVRNDRQQRSIVVVALCSRISMNRSCKLHRLYVSRRRAGLGLLGHLPVLLSADDMLSADDLIIKHPRPFCFACSSS